MQAYKKDFIEFCLSANALCFGEFRLKSGRISPYFFNAGLFNTGSLIAKLGEFYAAAIMAANCDYNVLYGPAYKGIPLVTSCAIGLANKFDQNPNFCFNRKEAKDHGEGGLIVGSELNGKVLIIDDVITAGTAIRESMEIISKHDAELAGIVITLDRQERGQGEYSAIQEISQEYNIKIYNIISLQDITEYLAKHTEQEDYNIYLDHIEKYRKNYGITE